MPIQIIPAPNVPDPMQQMGQMYEMFNMMQQAPLKKKLLEAQILGQQQDSARADRQMAIAEQDAANRNADAQTRQKEAQRGETQRAATAQGYVNAAEAAGLDPNSLAALTANAPAITPENEALIVPPQVQKYLFQQRLAANPMAQIEFQKAQQELANDKQHFTYTAALIEKARQGDGSTGKDLLDALDKANDNLKSYDDAVSNKEKDFASIEGKVVGDFLKTSVTGMTTALMDEKHPGNVWELDPKTGQPKIDPVTGYKVPLPQFAATWQSAIPQLDAAKGGIELAKERRAAYAAGVRKASSQVADLITTRYDVPIGITVTPPGTPNPAPTPQASSGDQLEQLVDMLSKADQAGGDSLRTIVSDPELRLPPDPALVDRWAQMAFPPSDGTDATKRAANIVRLKALLMKTQSTGTPASGYGAVK